MCYKSLQLVDDSKRIIMTNCNDEDDISLSSIISPYLKMDECVDYCGNRKMYSVLPQAFIYHHRNRHFFFIRGDLQRYRRWVVWLNYMQTKHGLISREYIRGK